jgi:plasmid stabilization system protein ParE
MTNVTLSNAAIKKLSDLRRYIAEELHSPIAADNTVSGIFDALTQLEEFPESGPLLSSIHYNVPARFAITRFLVCGKYIAIYDYDGDEAIVLRIYHGTEDYIRHLTEGY